jgi:hypothetical protein
MNSFKGPLVGRQTDLSRGTKPTPETDAQASSKRSRFYQQPGRLSGEKKEKRSLTLQFSQREKPIDDKRIDL